MDTHSVLITAGTHLLAFVAGGVSWFLFTLWEGRRVCLPDPQEAPVPDSPPRDPNDRRHAILSRLVRGGPPTFGAVVLVFSALLVAIGVQQIRFQDQADAYRRDAAARDACYERWGREVIRTRNTRDVAAKKEAAAEKARDEALDNVLLIVIGLRSSPPTAVDRDFDRTLARFAAAKATLQSVEDRADTTRKRNPYPRLRCTGATAADPSPSPTKAPRPPKKHATPTPRR